MGNQIHLLVDMVQAPSTVTDCHVAQADGQGSSRCRKTNDIKTCRIRRNVDSIYDNSQHMVFWLPQGTIMKYFRVHSRRKDILSAALDASGEWEH